MKVKLQHGCAVIALQDNALFLWRHLTVEYNVKTRAARQFVISTVVKAIFLKEPPELNATHERAPGRAISEFA